MRDFSGVFLRHQGLRLLFRSNRNLQLRLYRQLASLLGMKRPLADALDILWMTASRDGRAPGSVPASALFAWRGGLEKGQALSGAMASWVPERDLMLLAAGERSGNLEQVLLHLVEMEEFLGRIRSSIIQACGYVSFLLLAIIALVIVVSYQVIGPLQALDPRLVNESGLSLLGSLADLFLRGWPFFLVSAMGAIFLLFRTLPTWTGSLRDLADYIPPWSWYRFWQGAGAMLAIASLLEVQVPLREALGILERQASPWLAGKIRTVMGQLLRGSNLGEALCGHGLNFPDRQLATDMRIFAMRGDIGSFMKDLVRRWVGMKVHDMERHAGIARTIGLLFAGFLIMQVAGALYSIYGAIDTLGSRVS